MKRPNPATWLARQARRGVADLPRNVVWALDTTVRNSATSARQTLESVGHQAASALADANPLSDGADSRLHRVDAALERAREVETEARRHAENAKEQAEVVAKTRDEGDQRIAAARDAGEREVADVVAEAQREADEYVAAKRSRAEEIAAQQVESVEADVAQQVERAENDARKAHAQAERAIEHAREQMKQARELAEEAAVAARKTADEARARAERLADEADADAAAAQSKVDDADNRRKAVVSEGRKLGKDADTDPLDLNEMSKEELLALGAEMDLDLKSAMRKQQLVTSIRRARP